MDDMGTDEQTGGTATEQHAIDLGIPGYRAEQEIGRGGFAVVYRATRLALRQTVAVKLLLAADRDPQSLARFEREQMALGTLAHHPHIVTIHDGGITADGTPFLAMEHVRDGSLADRVRRSGPLPAAQVLDFGVKLAGAVETAHRAGVLHRDIKPENVLLSGYGQPLLADFGIAHVLGGTRTRSGVITASIAHAPPEVLDGRPSSPQSDVYSLASTLYCLLAGAPAFTRPTDEMLVQTIARVLSTPVPDLRVRGVPAPLCAVLEWAMAKQAGERPATALAFGEALRDVQRTLGLPQTVLPVEQQPGAPAPVAAPPPPPPAMATLLGPPGATASAPLPPPRQARRRRRHLVGVGVVLVAAVIGGSAVAIAGTGPGGTPQPVARPAPATSTASSAPLAAAQPATPTQAGAPTQPTVPAGPPPPDGDAGEVPEDLTPLLLEFTDLAPDAGELDPPEADVAAVLFCARPAEQGGKLREAKRALAPPYDHGYQLATHVAAFRPGEAQAFVQSLRDTAASCAERYAIDEPTPVPAPPGADEALRVSAQTSDVIWARRGDYVVKVDVSFRTSRDANRTTAPDLAARAIARVAQHTS
jgi:serine/threonine protein kinase